MCRSCCRRVGPTLSQTSAGPARDLSIPQGQLVAWLKNKVDVDLLSLSGANPSSCSDSESDQTNSVVIVRAMADTCSVYSSLISIVGSSCSEGNQFGRHYF